MEVYYVLVLAVCLISKAMSASLLILLRSKFYFDSRDDESLLAFFSKYIFFVTCLMVLIE
jgi:hypothetical protein